MAQAELHLTLCVSLQGGFLEPPGRFPIVPGDSLTLGIHKTDQSLGVGISLRGGPASPGHGCPVVLRQPLSLMAQQGDVVLRGCVSLARQGQQFSRGSGIFAVLDCLPAVIESGADTFHIKDNTALLSRFRQCMAPF